MARGVKPTEDVKTMVAADHAEGTMPPLPEPDSVAAGETRPAAEARELRGSLDKAVWPTIEGWVWDPELPEERIALELLAGTNPVAMAVADLERPDLVQGGIGDGSHAYKINLRHGALPAGEHVLHLRCADTGATVPGFPVTIEVPATLEAEAAFRWSVDGVTDQEVVGWIAVNGEPSQHCVVLLKEGGQVLARGIASQFRPDLLAAGIGDGCYAFSLQMPRSLLDGAEHLLEVAEAETGFCLNVEPLRWRSTAGTAGSALTGIGGAALAAEPEAFAVTESYVPPLLPAAPAKRPAGTGKSAPRLKQQVKTRILFDVSDLVYYIGHHPNLTGIQRVQSSIVLSMMMGTGLPNHSVIFLSFNARLRKWTAIPTGFLLSLLQDLFQPEKQRLVKFSADDARYGQLPGAQAFDGEGVLDDGVPSVLCLLGAAWVQRDYFHRILSFKRRFGTRFVVLVHDLIPIYARETSDQGTARVYEDFLRRALRHVDHYLSVSENTAKDLRRYITSLSLPLPSITVTRNGSSFDEFLPAETGASPLAMADMPERFVLFVSTIEGRKNHQLVLDVWRRMVAAGDDPPHLICVGRVGWKSERFVSELVESDYLDGKIILLQEISDALLKRLYDKCLFTVYPSFYEGWGLPAGESLAAGKICVCSDRASLPEVTGEFGVYIDIDNLEQSYRVIRDLAQDDKARKRLEAKIRTSYKPTTWREVALAIIGACDATAANTWAEPYPYAAIPYAAEISFASIGRETDAVFGDGMLDRIIDTRRGHFLADPLQELNFLRGEDARSGGIWAEPEGWGTWLCYAGGDIVVGLEPSDAQVFYVFLRLRASGGASAMTLRLSANGDPVWRGVLGVQPKDIMLRIRKRARATGGGWLLKLGARIDLSPEAQAQIAGIDGRVPTIGFERLVVVPEDDLKTRLEVVSNLVILAS